MKDEIGEQMQVADEISEAISNPIGGAMEDDVRRLVVSRAQAPAPAPRGCTCVCGTGSHATRA